MLCPERSGEPCQVYLESTVGTQKERIQIEMGNGEYGGRVKRGVDQEEMMKARVRVGRELSQQQGILPVV